jgi:hypothetical protein
LESSWEQTFQSCLVACVLLAVRGAGDKAAQAVDDQEHRVGQLWCGATRARAQLGEQVFKPVGETAHPHHADHAGGPLHRVRLAKDPVDRGVIVRRRLENEQSRSDTLEVALGLLDKKRSELVF